MQCLSSQPEPDRPTLEEVRDAFHADLLDVAFHQHVGIAFDREAPAGQPKLTVAARPEIASQEGEHSPATLYTLGDAAAALELCEAIAPRALELGKGAIFFTVSSSLRTSAPAVGTIGATAALVKGLDASVGKKGASRKGTVEVAAALVGGGGEQVGEQRSSFYVRFIDLSRMQDAFAPDSAIVRVLGR